MTTTPTSGAADLPEALHRVIDDFERRERGIPQAHIAAALVAELRSTLHALAARQAVAPAELTPDEGFFLLLPKRPKPEAPANTVGLTWDAYSGAQMLAHGRECSDAARKQGGA